MVLAASKRWLRAAVAIAITVALVGVLAVWRPSGLYPWLKALHVIAIIAWMAGMLYLPRLFVYHCEAEPGSKQSETFKLMERRLLTVIINPAMIVSWALGLWLAWESGWFRPFNVMFEDGLWMAWEVGWFKVSWFHAKLVLVLALSGLHGF